MTVNNDDDDSIIHPVIDVSPILIDSGNNSSNSKKKEETLKAIRQALIERGYFYAQNVHVLSKEYIDSIYQYSNRVHKEIPIEHKLKYSKYGSYTGVDIGIENAELDYNVGTVASVRAWDYSREPFTLSEEQKENEEENKKEEDRYPTSDIIDPPFQEVLDELYERQNILAKSLMIAFAECFHLPSDTFLRMFEGTTHHTSMDTNKTTTNKEKETEKKGGDFGTIRLLYYPGREDWDEVTAQNANVGISAHTDFEVFTLMHQTAPGLQFLPPQSPSVSSPTCGQTSNPGSSKMITRSRSQEKSLRWIPAPVREDGEFVVIIGDVLERITNGVLKATPHRVIKTNHERWSIIRFNAFESNVIIQPLPEFVSSTHPPLYTPVTMKHHVETTMKNLKNGLGAWDEINQKSLTATYAYTDDNNGINKKENRNIKQENEEQ